MDGTSLSLSLAWVPSECRANLRGVLFVASEEREVHALCIHIVFICIYMIYMYRLRGPNYLRRYVDP